MEWLVIFISMTAAQQCHSTCAWNCTGLTCPNMVCAPACQPLQCQICLNQTGTPVCYPTTHCTVLCPDDQCEFEQCPACEAQCPELCHGALNCTVTCQQPLQCNWACHKPTCPYPICREVCDPVACTESDATHFSASLALGLMTLVLFSTTTT